MSASVFEAADFGSMCEWVSIKRIESSSANKRWRSWSDIRSISDGGFRIGDFLASEAFVTVGARFGHSIAGLLSLFQIVGFGRCGNISRGLAQLLGTLRVFFIVCEFETLAADDVGDGGYQLRLEFDIVTMSG